ncbi:hypothetical protein HPB51_004998 [Rhipicephalus microplus]|uniref:SH3 domain-containing protein n=1 Tax=Rhipicephalus microplus TaxID=6941 RepID=A0A9J6DLJ1_RHIMP|nr:hypothetical protein HPB51_004998 [Rhipicephalus microplus]
MGGADPQCVACGTSSRMKCIWLNDAEFSFLRYQPWQCLRCAVNHSFEATGAGSPAARRNLCIWFTRVTRLKANYTELQCKMLSSSTEADYKPSNIPGYRTTEAVAVVFLSLLLSSLMEPYKNVKISVIPTARLENEDSALVNTPGYRTGDRSAEVTPRRDEKDYEPVDVGAQVRATYKYTAEDVDELNFESGEIIRVIEYDDPEEQEEGWLMGIKESTGEKGLFPANFTRPI